MITLPRNRKGPRECIGRILIGEGCRRRACQSSIFTRYYHVVRPSQAGVNDEHEPAQLPGRSPRPERPDLSPRLSQRRPPRQRRTAPPRRSEEHTSELQSQSNLVCRLLLEKKKYHNMQHCMIQSPSNTPSTLSN